MSEATLFSAKWYAIRTRSRHEKYVRDQLANYGVEHLLPTVIRLNQWKDRKKKIEAPLFPGYCFAQFPWQDKQQVLRVLQIPGVVHVVGSANRPEPILEEEIAALKAIMSSSLPYDAHPYLHEGMSVQVFRGPLEGLRGVLLRKEKHCRLVVKVHLIKQAAAVEIDAADVMPM